MIYQSYFPLFLKVVNIDRCPVSYEVSILATKVCVFNLLLSIIYLFVSER